MAEEHISMTSDFMDINEKEDWFKEKLKLDCFADLKKTFPLRNQD